MVAAQTGRKCIFCRRRANTKEHVWADWLLKKIPRRRGIRGERGKETFYIPGPDAELVVRFVCKRCNSGWMSDIENDAKPAIAAMVRDISFPLDASQQRTVAMWAVKTAMILDYFSPAGHSPFYSQDDRNQLMNSSTVPLNTFAWLARYTGPATVLSRGKGLWIGGLPEANGTTSGYVCTIAAGFFAVQLLSIRFPPKCDAPIAIERKPGNWKAFTVSIWPVVPLVNWPPAGSFSGLESRPPTFEQFAQRYSVGIELD